MITIGQISFFTGENNQNRVVQVEVIERRGDILRLRVNQVETMARATEEVPQEFLALAEVQKQVGSTVIKLTPLPWMKNEHLLLYSEKNLLSMVVDRLLFLGITSMEDYLPWGYALAKLGLPLSQKLLEDVFRLSRRYDKYTMEWILCALREGFPANEEVSDFLRHVTSWMRISLSEELILSSKEKWQGFLSDVQEIPLWIVQMFGNFSWLGELRAMWRERGTLVMMKKDEKKETWHVLLEDEIVGRWQISLEWASSWIKVVITMDPMIWERWENEMKTWAKENQKRWKECTGKDVMVMTHPWENPWKFFLPQEDISSPRGINLYA